MKMKMKMKDHAIATSLGIKLYSLMISYRFYDTISTNQIYYVCEKMMSALTVLISFYQLFRRKKNSYFCQNYK